MQKSVLLLCTFTAFTTTQLNAAANQKEPDSPDSIEKWLKDSGTGDELQKILNGTLPPPESRDTSEHPNPILGLEDFASPGELPNFSAPKPPPTMRYYRFAMHHPVPNSGYNTFNGCKNTALKVRQLLNQAKEANSLRITCPSENNFIAVSPHNPGIFLTISAGKDGDENNCYHATLYTLGKYSTHTPSASKAIFVLLYNLYQEQQDTKEDSEL